MHNRPVVAAVIASVVVVTGSGCYGRAKTLPQKTARITVADNSRTSHAVSCTQVQSLLTIDIGAAPAHARVLLRLDPDQPTPQTVDINDFNGFTGVANAAAGQAEAAFTDSTYTITGSAEGPDLEHPDTRRTASFQIEAQC
jgi:hypothetical protein